MRRIPTAVLVAAACGLFAGCGKPEQVYGEVSGTVNLNGKPQANLKVEFIPDPGAGNRGPASFAFTDAAGRYVLASDRGPAGGAVGKHRICVYDLNADPGEELLPPGSQATPDVGASPPVAASKTSRSRVPKEYYDFLTTPLKDIDVAGESQTIDIELNPAKRR